MIPEFRKSLYPWIVCVEGDNTREILESHRRIRQGLDDLLAFKISWHEYLDIVASEGVDMDEYLDIGEQNIITAGF